MATKPPPAVEEFTPESLEKIAYSVVADLEAREPNDRNRLGYNIWAWLKDRKGSLDQAVRAAGSRMALDEKEIVATVRKRLEDRGIKVS